MTSSSGSEWRSCGDSSKNASGRSVRFKARGLCVGVLGVEGDERAYTSVYPAVGAVVDRLVNAGARVIVGMSGAMAPRADALLSRATTELARGRLASLAQGLVRKQWLETFHGDTLTRPYTDEERARAERELALCGGAPVTSVVAYAERPEQPGLTVMTVPQNPVEAMAGVVAGGANIILVASSRGLFSGAIACPTLVVAPAPARPAPWMSTSIALSKVMRRRSRPTASSVPSSRRRQARSAQPRGSRSASLRFLNCGRRSDFGGSSLGEWRG